MEKDLNYFKKKKKIYEVIFVLFCGIAVISLFMLFYSMNKRILTGMIFVYVFGFLGFFGIAELIVRSFKNVSLEFKEIFLTNELKKIFPKSKYTARKGFSKNEVYNSNVLKKKDRYYSEDMIVGEFSDVKFRSADVTIKEVRYSGKRTKVVTTFQGRVFEFGFNKRFKANLLLIQPGKFRPSRKWNKIKLESVTFNSQLKAYTDGAHDTFYILTPQVMEKLLYLDRKYYDKISFSFINNKLYIAIDTRRDTFDIKIFGNIPTNVVAGFSKEFTDMKEFITELKLDSKLFISDNDYYAKESK